ncbi:hypothetical protein [Chitinibacter sp. GC72]|uniref:hypothetical protein n=1 Tax=Chitinibacter sp. GC72 TaxID=1526917 RepID=UPI0012F92392|nr:hypothetical protein [Chitinibacter sp. GC72]
MAFQLKDPVKLALSGERGCVVGVAQYVDSGDFIQVSYLAATGEQKKDWFTVSELVAE